MYLGKKKCFLRILKIEYLGHVITERVHMDLQGISITGHK